jgi:hypothetical protein
MASITKRPNGKYRARYRDAADMEHARHFDRKVDAQRWLDEVTAAVVRGDYVEPRAGLITLGEYAKPWLAARVHLKPKTVAGYESLLRTRVLPRWGDVPLGRVSFEVSQRGSRGWCPRVCRPPGPSRPTTCSPACWTTQ